MPWEADEALDVGKVDRLLMLLHQEYTRVGFLRGKADKATESPSPPPAPLVVSVSPPRVTVEGIVYPVDDSAAQLVQALVEAGDWQSGSSVVNQPSRVVAGMPAEVRRLIETAPGKGMRIKPAAE
ncbi:MAG: hypothetical protein NTW96_25370 [Planctomycetia bacterium]|nr:hypothetical protein [Planctomycetia bacterium]